MSLIAPNVKSHVIPFFHSSDETSILFHFVHLIQGLNLRGRGIVAGSVKMRHIVDMIFMFEENRFLCLGYMVYIHFVECKVEMCISLRFVEVICTMEQCNII